MLITAKSGNGKSTLFKVAVKKHPSVEHPDYREIPVLRVETPETPGKTRFLGAVLEAFGFYDYDRDSYEKRRIRVRKELEGTHVKLILVDEIHNLLAGSVRLKEETTNLLKEFWNTFEIPIVFAGTERAEGVFRYDPQLVRRYPIVRLPTWNDGQGFRALLRLLESTFPLPQPSCLYENEKAKYILKQSSGILADIIRPVRESARLALLDGSGKITMGHLTRSHFSSQVVIGPLIGPMMP